MTTNTLTKKEIKFIFTQKDFEHKNHAIRKADSEGRQRMYLCGVSSGLNIDAHGERMTEKAIASFMKQANDGMVLLFPDIHGIQTSQDIGKLVKAEILDNGDWYTEYRLYDEHDQVDLASTEKALKLWKQSTGLPPYDKPLQKGFSIEGHIPENGIVSGVDSGDGVLTQKVIDDVELEGVVLVGKPAYQTGIANAVYKALDELAPWRSDMIQKSIGGQLREMMSRDAIQDEYFSQRWNLNEALEKTIEKIMQHDTSTRKQELEVAFKEYSDLMTALILQSAGMFRGNNVVDDLDSSPAPPYGSVGKSESELLNTLANGLRGLGKQLQKEFKKPNKIKKSKPKTTKGK